jgi:hypothetical protein
MKWQGRFPNNHITHVDKKSALPQNSAAALLPFHDAEMDIRSAEIDFRRNQFDGDFGGKIT